MEDKNNREDHGKKRQTKIKEGYKDSRLDSNSRSVGDAPPARSEARDNKIGISRKAGKRGNTSKPSFSSKIPGGTISQLIQKAESQLAMLEDSAYETRKYIDELKDMAELMRSEDPEQ